MSIGSIGFSRVGRTRTLRRGALATIAAAALATLVACGDDSPEMVGPPDLQDERFLTYVALGNSITAGWQSGGIVDSTQRESYAFYLAQQMGTSFEYQPLRRPGCPAPLANVLTGARLDGAAAGACAGLVSNASSTVHNVAVPGATIADATGDGTPPGDALTLLLSGGRPQVSRALEANPTFVSVWLGNNDVLGAATTGLLTPGSPDPRVSSAGLTPPATFTAHYQRLVHSLRQAPRLRGGVLVGVVDVTGIPLLFRGAALNDPQVKDAIDLLAGREVEVVNCPATTPALVSLGIVGLLRAVPTLSISCARIPGETLAGDAFVVDSAERVELTATVAAYNAFIQQKAAELDFAYVDPNPLLAAQRQSGAVPAFPNLLNAAQPFGLLFSLDGVHPARAGHELVANALVEAINAKYGTTLAPVAGS